MAAKAALGTVWCDPDSWAKRIGQWRWEAVETPWDRQKRLWNLNLLGFRLCLITTFSVPWKAEGEFCSTLFWEFFFLQLVPSTVRGGSQGPESTSLSLQPLALSWPMAKELKMRNYADRVLVSYARRLRRLDRIYFEMLTEIWWNEHCLKTVSDPERMGGGTDMEWYPQDILQRLGRISQLSLWIM